MTSPESHPAAKPRTVLVTGGSAGNGLATARRFLQAGYTVVISGRKPEPLGEAVKALAEVSTRAGQISSIRMDVCDEIGTRGALRSLAERGVAIDVLVNNAGLQGNAAS